MKKANFTQNVTCVLSDRFHLIKTILLLAFFATVNVQTMTAQCPTTFQLINQPGLACGELGPNLLANPSFEDGTPGPNIDWQGNPLPPGWFTFGGYGGFPNIFTEVLDPRTGSQHIKMFGAFNAPFNVSGFGQNLPADPGETFVGSIYMMTPTGDDIAGGDNFAEVHLEFFDANGCFVGGENFKTSEKLENGSPVNQYIKFDAIATAPPGTVRMNFVAFFFNVNWNSGAVFYDDASLQRVIAPYEDITVTVCPGETKADLIIDEPLYQDDQGIASAVNNILGTNLLTGSYPVGNWPVTFTVTDNGGLTNSCSFNVNVVENPTPQTTLVCNDLIVAALDNNGQAHINPDAILEGGPYDCDNKYIIEIEDHKGDPVSNPVTCSDIGEELKVTITYTVNGSACWSELRVEDKTPPTLTCVNPTIPCTSTINQAPKPTSSDNCDNNPSEKLILEELVDADACDDNQVVYERTWVAVDDYDNQSAPCTQQIRVVRPTMVNFPDDRTWDCSHSCNNQSQVSINCSGRPTGLDGLYCQYGYTFSDEELEICGGAPKVRKVIRTWTVLDWCTGSVIIDGVGGEDNVQLLRFEDNTPPNITVPTEVTISANIQGNHPQPCKGRAQLPTPQTSDNCSGVASVKTFTPIGQTVSGNWVPQPGLAMGSYTITVQAEDECGNISEASYTLHVVDDIAPSVICDEVTEVDLSSDGLAKVNASVFDDGSYDNCCLDRIEVAKMEDDACGLNGDSFSDSVTFCCEDVTGQPTVVVMRVWDCYNNYNDCMVDVHVEDKQFPVLITCPGPASITCDYYWDNIETGLNLDDYSVLDEFGEPIYTDNCDVEVTMTLNNTVDQCGNGALIRTWQGTDAQGNGPINCTQQIQVRTVSDFKVEFPQDIDVDCGNTVPDFGSPRITDESCELIAISYSDEYFNSVPDACYKISRTWTVINWCVVGDDTDQEVEEISEFDFQFIVGFPSCDLDGDGDCDDRTFRDSWNGTDYPGAADAGLNGAPDTDPDADPWDGYIEYQQNIKVSDQVSPEFTTGCEVPDYCIDGTTCSTDVDLPTPDVSDCSTDVTITANGDLGSGFSFSDVEPGVYSVTYSLMDNCGNSNACQTTFEVKDCKKPTPYCKNGLIVELMNTNPPMIEIWATDFDEGSFDNCTEQDDLEFSFNEAGTQTSTTYYCDEVGTQSVEVWVTDEAGNTDYCLTVIVIQDNMEICPTGDPLVQLGGAITNEENESVENVEVSLTGNGNGVTTTDANGMYNFADIPLGGDYSIVPLKDINPLNGVSTFDLVLMTKHILGVSKLNSPYKIIAADVNKSKSVTTFDLVQLRKLILHIDDNFSNNTSWRFVDKGFQFPNPENPFETNFPELLNFNNIDDDELSADFIGIKIGDVNGNANPAGLTVSDDRNTTEALVLSTKDIELKAGETYTIDFNANDFQINGFQFTLNFDQSVLEFNEIIEGLAQNENFGLTLLSEGAVTSSWSNAEIINLNDRIFSLNFTAKTDAQLSDVLSVNSRFTAAEAYGVNGEMLDVNLHFEGSDITSNQFEVYQNTPNPFRENTTIGFNLPEATAVTLTLTEVSGKVIRVIEGEFAKGYNSVEISKKDLSANGVIYYKVETTTDTSTKKMVLMR